jgi:hypothetical protein
VWLEPETGADKARTGREPRHSRSIAHDKEEHYMRIKRRLMVVCALAATAALGAVGAAHAINANSTATLAVSPATGLGSAGKAVKLTVHTHTNYTVSGTKTTRARLFFDKNITFSPNVVPKCATASVSGNITMKQAMTACKPSLVGTGTAQANLTTPGDVHGCVLAFNAVDGNPTVGGNQPGILLFTRLQVPGNIVCTNAATNQNGNGSVLLQAPLATNPASTTPGGALTAAYYSGGKWLDFNNIPQTLPLSDFNVQTGKGAPQTALTGAKANYIKAKCTSRAGLGTPPKKFVLRTIFKYNSGTPTEQVVNYKTGACT